MLWYGNTGAPVLTVQIVTGYVPLPGMIKSEETYRELGQRLLSLPTPIRAFLDYPLESCWMDTFLEYSPLEIEPYVADCPQKNTLAYHTVQHQKTQWMAQAAEEEGHGVDVFVWIDFGVFHLPGVTEEVILDFLARVNSEENIAIPGCWSKRKVVLDQPCWRFCGTVLACPRRYVAALNREVRNKAVQLTVNSQHSTWEVNTWALVEQGSILPIRQYHANHDESLFTAYPGTSD